MGRILVIRGGAIGDFVLTLPVFSALRRTFPQARLAVLGYAHIASLALAGGLVDEVRSIEAGPLAGFFARHGTLSAELAEYFGSFDIVISYLYDPDDIFRTNVARCSKAQFIVGPHRPDEAAALPASEVFLKPLEKLAIFEADPVPRLELRSKGSGEPGAAEHRLAAHPGSGSPAKNWPRDRWTDLLRRVALESRVVLASGEAEADWIELLAGGLPGVERAHNLALVELAGRLCGCNAFIGQDSGISHLAAALGLPGLVLWGESVEKVWRPPSPKVVVVREAGGLSSLTVDRVLREWRLRCHPGPSPGRAEQP